MLYKFDVVETYRKPVYAEAGSEAEAREILERKYYQSGEIFLTDKDYDKTSLDMAGTITCSEADKAILEVYRGEDNIPYDILFGSLNNKGVLIKTHWQQHFANKEEALSYAEAEIRNITCNKKRIKEALIALKENGWTKLITGWLFMVGPNQTDTEG
jgi:hypothetical protein